MNRGAWFTAGLLCGSIGMVYGVNQFEVGADVTVDGNTFRINTTTNKVGINQGVLDLHEALNIAGVLMLEDNGGDPTPRNKMAMLYANYDDTTGDVELWGIDEDGNTTDLTSHVDPRSFDPNAPSSFADPSVALPFSFHHFNPFIGIGAVSDLTRALKDLEQITGNSYTTVYGVSPEKMLSVTKRLPGVEIPISEASELVEITEPGTVTEYVYDLGAEQVTAVQVPSDDVPPVGTGVYEKRLKDGVWFDNSTGKFHRERTPEEIEPGMTPDLPQWIIDRLPNE